MANLFPTSLFGYSKTGVNDYISKLNEEVSRKLLEKEREHKEEVEALRAENARLAQENERLQALRQEVADALISAKDYASGLKRQAEEEDQIRRAAGAARQEAECRRIQAVAEQVDGLCRNFRDTLERMDRETAAYTEELQRLRAAAERQADAAEQAHTQKEGTVWADEDGQA